MAPLAWCVPLLLLQATSAASTPPPPDSAPRALAQGGELDDDAECAVECAASAADACAADACAASFRQLRSRPAALQEAHTLARGEQREGEHGGAAHGLSELLRSLLAGVDDGDDDEEALPWNSSFFDDLGALAGDLPAQATNPLEDTESLPSTVAPWHDANESSQEAPQDEEAAGDLDSMSALLGPSCQRYGCIKYNPHRLDRTCQCNHACRKHGDCCHDYHAVCSPNGGGKIVAEKAWVALVDGQSDKKFQKMLCGIVRHFSHGPICHNGIIFKGTVAGRHGYFFLEYGNSGYPDVLTGRKKWGLSIAPARERFQGKRLLVRRIYPNLERLSYAVQVIRETPYFLSAAAIGRLLHRTNKRFSAHLMCSDFTADVLVWIGCLANDKASWNAQPTDFSSKAKHHRLHYTCKVGPDMWWDTRQR